MPVNALIIRGLLQVPIWLIGSGSISVPTQVDGGKCRSPLIRASASGFPGVASLVASRHEAPSGETEAGPEDDRRPDAEHRVKGDLDRHHREMEAAADADPLQRQYDEPVHDQGGEAEDEPACPLSEKGREPRLEHRVDQSPEPGPER